MWIWKKLQNKKGFTLIELIVTFVLIGLVIIFKNQLTSLVNSIFGKITSQAGSI